MAVDRTRLRCLVFFLSVWMLLPLAAHAEDEAPEAFVKRVSIDVLESIKADKGMRNGDVNRVMALVDTRIMPNLDFARMTASAANEPGFAVVADVFRVDIGDQQPIPDAEIAELRGVTAATASGIEIAPLAREFFLPA